MTFIVYPSWLWLVSRFLLEKWVEPGDEPQTVCIQALVITNCTYAGPFVMNSYDEISQAITDYSMGQNGFGWKSVIGKSSICYTHIECASDFIIINIGCIRIPW